MLVSNFKAFLTNLDWQKYEDSASGNSPFVIGDSVSSNHIIKMKKQRLDNANNTHCKFLILIMRKNILKMSTNCSFWVFFTCQYSETVWLAENLNEIRITHYEKIFTHIKQNFSQYEKGLELKNIFCLTEITIIFSDIFCLTENTIIFTEIHHIKTKPKNNFQKI